MTRGLAVLAAGGAIAAALGATAWAWNLPTAGDAAADSRALPVVVEPITLRDSYVVKQTFSGVLAPRRESLLSFETSGKVLQLLVDEGDAVRADQELAVLDQRRLQAEQRRLAAQLEQAQAVFSELEAGPRQTEKDAAQAELEGLEAQLALEQANFDRVQKLFRRSVVTKEEFDRAEAARKTLVAQVAAARNRWQELRDGTRAEQLAAQRATIAQIRSQLERIEIDLADSTLRAPYAGSIAARQVDPGTVVAAGAPVFRLIESHALEARIGLPPRLTHDLASGQQTEIIVGERRATATIRAVGPEVDRRTRTQTVILDLTAAAGIAPGQVVRWPREDEIAARGAWVPLAALRRGERGLWECLTIAASADGKASVSERNIVEALHEADGRVFVSGTLRSGDQVISGGLHRIVAGQRVTPVSVVASETTSAAADMLPGGAAE